MRIIGQFIVTFLVLLGLLALVPLAIFGFGLVLGLLAFAIWLLPFVIIAVSGQTTGLEKLLWLAAMIFLSWFAWIFYFFLAPLKPRRIEYCDYRV